MQHVESFLTTIVSIVTPIYNDRLRLVQLSLRLSRYASWYRNSSDVKYMYFMKVVQFLLSVVKDVFTVELFSIMYIQLKQNLHFFKDFFMTLISSLKVFIFVKRLFYLSVLIENFQSLKIVLSCRIFLCRNSSHCLSNLTVIYNFINVNANVRSTYIFFRWMKNTIKINSYWWTFSSLRSYFRWRETTAISFI